ncbi:MAG TPA: acetyl-CoA carboxylase biotin carboxylase subunit, partial [Ktedonobacteraceae bacterium]|nr:acetyl-CoA carboxylase biotin carboxylase subunit [Ktedonobacteraceae bacterium]
LEINARIQVEHPVTEECIGLDLVQEQFRIAAGLPLSFSQEEVTWRGAAIECRISAEDPENRFLPATGLVQALHEPAGPGVRVESSLYAGLQVPLFYDPLLAKLIVWGRDRTQAIARMRRALDEYQIVGVRTTLPFARWLMDHPRFLAGDFSTDFIAQEWDGQNHPAETASGDKSEEAAAEVSSEQVAALVGALLMHEQIQDEQTRRSPVNERSDEGSRWRMAGRMEILRRL